MKPRKKIKVKLKTDTIATRHLKDSIRFSEGTVLNGWSWTEFDMVFQNPDAGVTYYVVDPETGDVGQIQRFDFDFVVELDPAPTTAAK
jgi:hypothetical protein